MDIPTAILDEFRNPLPCQMYGSCAECKVDMGKQGRTGVHRRGCKLQGRISPCLNHATRFVRRGCCDEHEIRICEAHFQLRAS